MVAVLPIHIAAGTVSVLAGAAALIFRKGGKIHRKAGTIFVVAMVIMSLTAGLVGISDPANAVAGALTIYFVVTAWVTARRKEKKAGLFEIGAFVVALTFAGLGYWNAYLIATGVKEAANPYIIYASLFVNSAIALAAFGDLSVVLRRGITGPQRIARHLWRMCFGLFIAVGSFSAQGVDALPAALPGPQILLASILIVLLTMVYWLVRVLFTGWLKRAPQPT